MTYYFVLTPDVSHAAKGSFHECQLLAEQLTVSGDIETLYVARSRAGEPDATVIFEFDSTGHRQCRARRRLSRQVLLQISKRQPLSLSVTNLGG
jgi:hypothetical protein